MEITILTNPNHHRITPTLNFLRQPSPPSIQQSITHHYFLQPSKSQAAFKNIKSTLRATIGVLSPTPYPLLTCTLPITHPLSGGSRPHSPSLRAFKKYLGNATHILNFPEQFRLLFTSYSNERRGSDRVLRKMNKHPIALSGVKSPLYTQGQPYFIPSSFTTNQQYRLS